MYHYSLEWFKQIYTKSLEDEDEGMKDNASKQEFYKKNFMRLLYSNVCLSLYDKDKLLLSFLFLMKVLFLQNKITKDEIRFLLAGSSIIDKFKPNPTSQKIGEDPWISDKSWCSILDFSKSLPAFKGFSEEFENNLEKWRACFLIHNIENVEENAWPDDWSTKLNSFQRLIVINSIRPDRLKYAIQNLIKDELGKEFIEIPSYNLE